MLGGGIVDVLPSTMLADQQHARDRKYHSVAGHAHPLQAPIADHRANRTEQAQRAGAEEPAADATLRASGVEPQAT